MGNASSSLEEPSEEPVSDDSSSHPALDTASNRSFTSVSSTEEEEEDYYYHDDNQEDTIICSSLFSRKLDPLLLHSSSPKKSTNTMKRSASSLCYPITSNQNECSPKTVLPRASSWTSFDEYTSYTLEELNMHNGDLPTTESDLRPSHERGYRNFWIVTTAALPWMTGTAVNPLLRAAHLSRMNRPFTDKSTVTLVVPWLESAQERVQMYGCEWEDKTQSDQDVYIRRWLSERAGLPLEADEEQGGIRIQYVCCFVCVCVVPLLTCLHPLLLMKDSIQHDCILA